MRGSYSVWCNNSRKKSYIPVVSPNSVFTEHLRTPYSVWCDLSQKVLSTELFFFLFQYLQRTCDGNTQCDSITLKKSLTNLSFLLIQFLQRTCERHTQCDAIFLKSTFYRPVLFPNSIPTEDMRTPYSVWCHFSRKNFLQTCFFS